MSQSKVADLVKAINSLNLQSLTEEDRTLIQLASIGWVNRFALPPELWFRLAYEESGVSVALKICGDLGLFEAWIQNGGGEKDAKELASITKQSCHPEMLDRFLRLLAAASIIDIRGKKYRLTTVSKQFDNPVIHSSNEINFHFNLPIMLNMPKFLGQTNYMDPQDAVKSNASDALNLNGALFSWFAGKEQMAHNFHEFITWMHSIDPIWTEIYPTEKLVAEKLGADPILVDVGGGTGRNILFFTKIHSVPRQALVLQDLTEPIARASTNDIAESMVHDFFTPQPIKGARAYLLAHILHDWPDDKAKEIFQNIKGALTPCKSRILLYEIVVRPGIKSMYGTTMDIVMMSAHSSRERTLEMWTELVTSAGLKIVKVHSRPNVAHAVLELEANSSFH